MNSPITTSQMDYPGMCVCVRVCVCQMSYNALSSREYMLQTVTTTEAFYTNVLTHLTDHRCMYNQLLLSAIPMYMLMTQNIHQQIQLSTMDYVATWFFG